MESRKWRGFPISVFSVIRISHPADAVRRLAIHVHHRGRQIASAHWESAARGATQTTLGSPTDFTLVGGNGFGNGNVFSCAIVIRFLNRF
jgi:hypothetical protein